MQVILKDDVRHLGDVGDVVNVKAGYARNYLFPRGLAVQPFYAGHAAGFGLTSEQALQLVTSNTANILGIGERYGTLQIGKSATLFVSRGDALDMSTNQLTHAFIDGRSISLETHQTELYQRYSKKYGHKIQQ